MVESKIQGVYIRRLERYKDDRGWLSEIFRSDELDESLLPKMTYVSVTRPGVTRGPHEHKQQTDLFAFPGFSSFRIKLWDNRADSPTYRQRIELESTVSSPLLVVIPPGVVHAYTNTGEADGITINCPNTLYKGEGKKEPVDEIRYEDKPDSPFKI